MHHSDFVHLHLHTQWSLLDGAIRPEAVIELAGRYRMPAVAVTDHGNIFGAVDFYQKAISKGIKPIIGCEIYVSPGKMTDRAPVRGGEYAYHLVLLVKNAKGYRNLCKLLTLAYLDGFYYRPRVDKELLAELNEGLIALSACLQGEVSYHLNAGDRKSALAAAASYREIFPERRFFLELQKNGMGEQEKANSGLIEVGRELDIPVVATNDCHYLLQSDSRVHDILLCIQTGTTVNSPDRMRFPTDQFYFKSPEEMYRSFGEVPQALRNTVEIAERCNLELKLGEAHLPDFPVPEGETLDSFIEKKALRGLEERLKGGRAADASHYYERLRKELSVIRGMGFSGYFLIVSDFIDYARSRGIPVGPGRGSAAGSLVAYSLGITSLDPIRYNLLFERFLNPDRVSLPDIDIDFCFEKRDEVIRYVTEKYGPENVTQIITFGQMKAKAVIRDVGRALDMPYGEVDRIAKLVPNTLNITIEEALRQEPRLKRLTEEDSRVGELIEAAKALEGLPRHASTHAAGVVISNRPIHEYLPLYKGQKENIVTTQYSMKDVEKIGLVKFDFLGLKTLTVIARTLELIKRDKGVDLDINAVSPDDALTFELIAGGGTNGIFQLESSGMKELLKKLRPENFEDLIAAVALYRPGPLQSGMVDDFIKRKHGRVSIKYELPELKGILAPTYGVIVYQEQVMEIAKVLAGFTPGDADFLRKAMGKKLPEEMAVQRERFLKGARNNRIAEKKAEKIFDLMEKFAGYGFNKSHSAAYALISFQTAYLKAHYPLEFMAALLSSDMGDTDQVVKYINECKEMGIPVDPPDINTSLKEFTVKEGRVRFGLGAVKNLGDAAIDEIIAARREAPFASLADFIGRADTRPVNKKVMESLIKCGAFDSMGLTRLTRASLMGSLDTLMDAAQTLQRDRREGQQSIFEVLPREAREVTLGLTVKELPEWQEGEKLKFEKETLGFYFSSHPLNSIAKEMLSVTTCTIDALRELDAVEATVGGIITERRETVTKKGERMAFARLEDLSGGVEVVVFSDLFRKASSLIASEEPVVVTGKLENEEETVKLIAQDIRAFEEARGRRVKRTHILASAEALDKGKLLLLKEVLVKNPGTSPVALHLIYRGAREVVIELDLSVKPEEEIFSQIRDVIQGAEIKVS